MLSSFYAIAVAANGADVAHIIDGDDDDDFVIIMKARCLPRLPVAAAGNMKASTRASFRDQIAELKAPY